MSELKTLEQLKEEARVAAEAVAAAERAEREAKEVAERAEREAKVAAAKRDRVAKQVAALEPLRVALVAKGFAPTIDETGWSVTLAVQTADEYGRRMVGVHFEEVMINVSSWRSRGTGRYALVLDRYGDEREVRYPPKKDGTYSVDKITRAIVDRVDMIKARADARRKTKTAKEAADELARVVKAACGDDSRIVGSYGVSYPKARGHEWHEYSAPAGKVYFQVGTLTVTPEQAEALKAALDAIKNI